MSASESSGHASRRRSYEARLYSMSMLGAVKTRMMLLRLILTSYCPNMPSPLLCQPACIDEGNRHCPVTKCTNKGNGMLLLLLFLIVYSLSNYLTSLAP